MDRFVPFADHQAQQAGKSAFFVNDEPLARPALATGSLGGDSSCAHTRVKEACLFSWQPSRLSYLLSSQPLSPMITIRRASMPNTGSPPGPRPRRTPFFTLRRLRTLRLVRPVRLTPSRTLPPPTFNLISPSPFPTPPPGRR